MRVWGSGLSFLVPASGLEALGNAGLGFESPHGLLRFGALVASGTLRIEGLGPITHASAESDTGSLVEHAAGSGFRSDLFHRLPMSTVHP